MAALPLASALSFLMRANFVPVPSSVIRSSDAPLHLSASGKRCVAVGQLAVRRSGPSLARAVFAGVVLCFALSGCGVFCGAAGGSSGAFAGGCSTGMRF
jgi:hypothetical protein